MPAGVKKAVGSGCELCASAGGALLWRDGFCRVVLVDDANYPGFCRVILNRHAGEMTDLLPRDRARLMRVVFATESALRTLARPDKINLASLGNVVPHLHWHVIPRYRDDAHFPRPVWAGRVRPSHRHAGPAPQKLAVKLHALLSRN